MFAKNSIKSKLIDEMNAQLDHLSKNRTNADDYAATLERVSKLQKLKSEEGLKPPSMDAVLGAVASLAGIFWITAVERDNIVTSKAIGFVMKPKL